MVNRVEYKDIDGNTTRIDWFPYDNDDASVYEFQCADDTPLVYKYKRKDNYTPLMASDVTIKILITSETDRQKMIDTQSKIHFVNIYKDFGSGFELEWIGEISPRYFDSPYMDYPYILDFGARDVLFKTPQIQPVLTDFPEPFTYDTAPDIMQFINKLFTIGRMWYDDPVGGITQPKTIRTNTRFKDFAGFFYGVKIDPLTFCSEDNVYDSISDILSQLLSVLHLRIFQWKAKLYLVDIQYLWHGGGYDWIEYDFNPDGLPHAGDFGTDFVDVYELFSCETPDPSGAIAINPFVTNENVLPPVSQLRLSINAVKNEQIMPVSANRMGYNFVGTAEQSLEYDSEDFGGTGRLRHWTYEPDTPGLDEVVFEIYPPRNSGIIGFRNEVVTSDTGFNQYEIWNVTEFEGHDIPSYLKVNLEAQSNWDTRIDDWAHIDLYIMMTSDSHPTYYLVQETFGEASSKLYWDTTAQFIRLKPAQEFKGEAIEVPIWADAPENVKLYVKMVTYKGITSEGEDYVKIKRFAITAENTKYEGVDWKAKLNYIINDDSIDAPVKKEFKIATLYKEYGFYFPSELDHAFAISNLYEKSSDGNYYPVIATHREGETGSESFIGWYIRTFKELFDSTTRLLNFNMVNRNYNIFDLFKDYYGDTFEFFTGEYNDKLGQWKIDSIQLKYIQERGDFNNDFSSDFWIN